VTDRASLRDLVVAPLAPLGVLEKPLDRASLVIVGAAHTVRCVGSAGVEDRVALRLHSLEGVDVASKGAVTYNGGAADAVLARKALGGVRLLILSTRFLAAVSAVLPLEPVVPAPANEGRLVWGQVAAAQLVCVNPIGWLALCLSVTLAAIGRAWGCDRWSSIWAIW
jgi:hypothetical protein